MDHPICESSLKISRLNSVLLFLFLGSKAIPSLPVPLPVFRRLRSHSWIVSQVARGVPGQSSWRTPEHLYISA
ncbi:hypothetical protein B0H15DRAFT_818985 [Mycena belliarum]|uniref:Uncharacterized protein n=1 Tax=Mycena belliarum TaxID=1033014 RepID=A0AAD6UKW8_9AGAR|nr:hypothetical protein B0H15DRAFT_818985 [Mycena belliae]